MQTGIWELSALDDLIHTLQFSVRALMQGYGLCQDTLALTTGAFDSTKCTSCGGGLYSSALGESTLQPFFFVDWSFSREQSKA